MSLTSIANCCVALLLASAAGALGQEIPSPPFVLPSTERLHAGAQAGTTEFEAHLLLVMPDSTENQQVRRLIVQRSGEKTIAMVMNEYGFPLQYMTHDWQQELAVSREMLQTTYRGGALKFEVLPRFQDDRMQLDYQVNPITEQAESSISIDIPNFLKMVEKIPGALESVDATHRIGKKERPSGTILLATDATETRNIQSLSVVSRQVQLHLYRLRIGGTLAMHFPEQEGYEPACFATRKTAHEITKSNQQHQRMQLLAVNRSELTFAQLSDSDELQFAVKREPASLRKTEARQELFRLVRAWREDFAKPERFGHLEKMVALVEESIDHPLDRAAKDDASQNIPPSKLLLDPWVLRWEAEVRLGPAAVTDVGKILVHEAKLADAAVETKQLALRCLCRMGWSYGMSSDVYDLWSGANPTLAEQPVVSAIDWRLVDLRQKSIQKHTAVITEPN